ncbi:molybdenum cofactor synthesis protein-like protein 2 large subunit [Lepidopterella palustris CBS 459.81]|uniref:Molybdopterin synthase catalytic subunit n=1 Tax=Lepidopterella palustris CBS 459.81 TaxID=1314670 RepID=A0A8E2DYH6_9PEZI|nr:molybdenum cofactor synthesis protein-like protein 2 large subunit [Lepidopterella palustris CBS 459.81]
MATTAPSEPTPPSEPMIRTEPHIYVELTYSPLDTAATIARAKSPEAGAVVLFLGTTRNTFASLPVLGLTYQSYVPLALSTLLSIARSILSTHSLTSISITHRLGEVPIGEESIAIAVSAPHRQAAWRGGEEALEMTKERAEIWKLERFDGGEGVWRANRDGVMGVRVGEGDDREKRRGSYHLQD